MLKGIILLNQGIIFLYKVYDNSNIKKWGEGALPANLFQGPHILH